MYLLFLFFSLFLLLRFVFTQNRHLNVTITLKLMSYNQMRNIFFGNFWSRATIFLLLHKKTAQIKLYLICFWFISLFVASLIAWNRKITLTFRTKSTFNYYLLIKSLDDFLFFRSFLLFLLNAQTEKKQSKPNIEKLAISIGHQKHKTKVISISIFRSVSRLYACACACVFFWLKRKKITFLLANIIKMYAWNPNCTIRKKSGCCVFFLVFCFVTAEKFIYMYNLKKVKLRNPF